ncbi:MAG: hypothetical protein HDS84_03710 [Bacteroidales bacterium]|nr:hypothetical protein [Bacteroidales bacterium]MBD5302718.1 hypothetical protein [Bacteroides sp.]
MNRDPTFTPHSSGNGTMFPQTWHATSLHMSGNESLHTSGNASANVGTWRAMSDC